MEASQHNEHLFTAISAAYNSGIGAAHEIRKGMVFMGAHPEAIKRGFQAPMLKSVFTVGYLSTMKVRDISVICDPHGIVTDLTRPYK